MLFLVVRVSNYHLTMKCKFCSNSCIRKGFQKNGIQKYYCSSCKKYQQKEYSYFACYSQTNQDIVSLIKASCGIRDISRVLSISSTTVLKRILLISDMIRKPIISRGKTYEVDEMITHIGRKDRKFCIVYAIDRKSRSVVDFNVGRRNKTTLRMVVNTLLLSESKEIRTDRLNLYLGLIPEEIHLVKRRGTNYIERKNLTLRTQLKRLNRRSIAYTRSLAVLVAVLKIYFWY